VSQFEISEIVCHVVRRSVAPIRSSSWSFILQLLKLHILHTNCHKSDMLQSVWIILRELLNIIKSYIKKT